MGIRIHKCIGYGIIGDVTGFFRANENEDDENHYNPLAVVPDTEDTSELKDAVTDPKFQAFYADLKGDPDTSVHRFRTYDSFDVSKCMVSACDGDPEGMIFYMHKDWYRYDDIIDYIETDSSVHEFKYTQQGIYPYNSPMICNKDCPSGKKGERKEMSDYKMDIGTWDDDVEAHAKGKVLDSLKAHWRYTVPPSLILAIYLDDNIIKKRQLIMSLQPCKATWWC
jgi:hypothetical protein